MGRPKGSKNKISKRIKKICKVCNKIFFAKFCHREKAKHCSCKCYWKSLKGRIALKTAFKKDHIPWNKGMKNIYRLQHSGSFKKGNHPKTEFKKGHKPISPFKKGHIAWNKNKHIYLGGGFKKGHTPWNRNKKVPQISGKNSHWWKGGEVIDNNGYVLIYSPNHPFKSSTNYVRRSHLIVEKYLGRFLKPKEIVHHINEIKTDDRIENFIVFINAGYHCAFHRYGYYNPTKIIFDGSKINELQDSAPLN